MLKMHILVLGLLIEKSMYAYEFKKIIKEREFDRWANVQLRSVYSALKVLQKRGFVSGEDEIRDNKKITTIYTIKTEGKRYLKEMVEECLTLSNTATEYWLGISFMFGTTRSFVTSALQKKIEHLQEDLRIAERWSDVLDEPDTDIPLNYQHLIRVHRRCLSSTLEELIILRNRIIDGEDRDFFLAEED
ncbi:MAG: PadR family transcriptional regulator [Candidatus Cloacimonetes bacterium]|nr:PadR family transcriptional regulator [Candidatus Cloacimonadota bacterium]